MKLDPRIFIHARYITCPKGHVGAYGVLSIGGNWYTRRCRECWHTANYALPQLRKKVIHIDQFAVSNMMKALNDDMESHERAKADPFGWSSSMPLSESASSNSQSVLTLARIETNR